jgi:outer membrane protein
MRSLLISLLLTAPLSALAQINTRTNSADLPAAPLPSSTFLIHPIAAANYDSSQFQAAPANQQQPLVDPATATISITRTDAERLALKNNPRITASHLLALAAGQVTRETRSSELPQISGAITAEKAEDGSRIGAGDLTDSRLYTHAGTGGSLSQLITDFGHTHDLVATDKLQQKAQDQTALATEQDVLLATDQAFYRLLDAQSLLEVAKATVAARGDVQNLTSALTKSALKSDLDLNIASADLSEAQLPPPAPLLPLSSRRRPTRFIMQLKTPRTHRPHRHRPIVPRPSTPMLKLNVPTFRLCASMPRPTRSSPPRSNSCICQPSPRWRSEESLPSHPTESSSPNGTQRRE